MRLFVLLTVLLSACTESENDDGNFGLAADAAPVASPPTMDAGQSDGTLSLRPTDLGTVLNGSDAGTCPVETLASAAVLAPSLALDDEFAYWIRWRPADQQGLFKTPKVGGPSILVTAQTEQWQVGSDGPVDLAVDTQNIYYTYSGATDESGEADGKIMVVSKLGGDPTVLVDKLGTEDPNCVIAGSPAYRAGHPQRVATDGDFVYWSGILGNRWCPSAPSVGSISRTAAMGGSVDKLASFLSESIAVDDTSLVAGGAGIVSYSKSNDMLTTLAPMASVAAIAIDPSLVFFADGGGTVYSVPRAGGIPTALFTPSQATVNDDRVHDLVASGDEIYWSSEDTRFNIGSAHIQKVRKDGTGWTILQYVQAQRLAVDLGHLYWIDWGLHKSCR